MYRLVRSPFGLTLRGIKDSELRMSTSGYNVWLHKYIVFVIAGVFAGVAGVLYTYSTQFISPTVLGVETSFEAMLMVIVGGAGTLVGPIIGAAVVTGLRNYLSVYVENWVIVLGVGVHRRRLLRAAGESWVCCHGGGGRRSGIGQERGGRRHRIEVGPQRPQVEPSAHRPIDRSTVDRQGSAGKPCDWRGSVRPSAGSGPCMTSP